MKQFDEIFYLENNPDVRTAIQNGTCSFKSGYDHFQKCGINEKRKYRFIDGDNSIVVPENNQQKYQHPDKMILGNYKEPSRNIFVNMVDVPLEYRQIQQIEYPEGNVLPFEQYFYKKFTELKPDTFRTYLPIFWTSYYVNNKYATDKNSMLKLKNFIERHLDKKIKYFTIVQYDDGILTSIEGFDILVYSMGCMKPGYYPIPLICQPINNNKIEFNNNEKDILFSFIGDDTHGIRKNLVTEFKKTKFEKFVQFKHLPKQEYLDILKRTKYALCPRGYGITSFRMFEAMAFGCVPVYISDNFLEPFNLPFESYGIKIKPENIKNIQAILEQSNFAELQKEAIEIYNSYFIYSQTVNQIINTLKF